MGGDATTTRTQDAGKGPQVQMNRRLTLIVTVALLGLAAFGLGWWVQARYFAGPTFTHAKTYPEPRSVPEVTLVGGDGQALSLSSLQGQFVLLFFGFTHCPDICPAALQNLAGELKAMGPAAERMHTLFVSVDPQRDTPSAVAKYAGYFHPAIRGVTAPREELDRLTKGVGAYYFLGADAAAGKDDYDVTHSTSIYVLNPRGQLVAVYSGDGKAGRIADDFAFLAS